MPTYKVTDSLTGKVARLTGDSPPTGQEIEQIFNSAVEKKNDMAWDEVATKALENLPESAVNYGKSLIYPFQHPIQAGLNIRDIVVGGVGKVFPGAASNEQTAKFDALKTQLSNRYGGYENIKNTIATDPIGFLGDASTVFTGGGAAAARVPGIVGKVGKTVANAGRSIEPFYMAKQAAGQTKRLIPKTAPLRLYESAIKPPAPTAKFNRAEQAKVMQAGIDAGIMPTEFGIDKLQGIIDDLNGQIMGKIKNGSQSGMTVSTADIAKRLDDADSFFINMPDSDSYLSAIDKVRQGVLSKGDNLTLEQTQKMKQTIYKVMQNSYGELSTATKEANKAVARGAKEEILNIFPEINDLNSKESLLLKLEPIIEKAQGRVNKRDLMGIGTPIAGAAMSSVSTPGIGAAAWVAKAVLDNPKVKAYLAIALNKAKKGKVDPGWVDQRLALYAMGEIGQSVDASNINGWQTETPIPPLEQ